MSQEVIDRKAKTKLPPQPVPVRPPAERVRDFAPVKLGFDQTSAIAEASRCLLCPKQPCVDACPLNNDIPQAMRLLSEGDIPGAASIYRLTSTMPEICSRVCPHDTLCEGACVLNKRGQALALGALEQFVADAPRPNGIPARPAPTGHTIGIIGAGPAGLAAAQRLLERGHDVTLYEALPSAGGWLAYAIPTYKLPRRVVEDKITDLEMMGAQFIYNTRVGEQIALDDLRALHDALFIGVGAMIDAQVDLPGRDLPGVYTGTDFLMPVYAPHEHRPPAIEPPTIGARVVVFGGGDTAMDCVRTAIRLQTLRDMTPDVQLIYRRTAQEMPASHRERKLAMEEGVRFEYLAAPTAFDAGPDGRLRAVTIQRMELGEPDSSGRRRPVPIEGSETVIEADTAVLALGYWPDPLISQHVPDLVTHKWGLIVVDDATGATNLPGIFAGGDAVRGPALVSRAVRDGIVAANAIHAYLSAS